VNAARSLLVSLLFGCMLPLAWRAAAPHLARASPPAEAPAPVAACVPVEARGIGVGCVAPELAAAAGLRAGDVIARDGPRRVVVGRMAPARLEAWQAPVDVNRASVDELASLPGIGPALAARIAAARPFAVVDDVVRVRGIGPKTLARIRGRLIVLPSTASTR
jgi:competence protein ComEA